MGVHSRIPVVECFDLPSDAGNGTVYKLLPKNPDQAYYRERTDRNIGWITREEQEALGKSVIGIAGCGGMGAQLAEKFLRLGVGEIRIADIEAFDVSNINRQFAASRGTVGKPKAFETAKMLRAVTDDFTLVVYPQGIGEDSAESFVSGCDAICDEIEFWAIGARILLHREARVRGVPVFCCPTVGFGTRLFRFTPQSATMEDCLGFTYEEASALQRKIQTKTAARDEVREVMAHILRGLIPEIPDYMQNGAADARKRLLEECKAPIIATNPALAAGFVADHVLLHLLEQSSIRRSIVQVPEMPGYLYFDAATMIAKIVRERWW